MTDIGFMELVMIALMALLVMGPRQMLQLITDAGYWYGRLQRWLSELRLALSRELSEFPPASASNPVDWLSRKIRQDTDSKPAAGEAPPPDPGRDSED